MRDKISTKVVKIWLYKYHFSLYTVHFKNMDFKNI